MSSSPLTGFWLVDILLVGYAASVLFGLACSTISALRHGRL